MKFLRIVFQNVFAYEGEVSFDLSDTTKEKNIVLIWGRNGMGKTSFLNAVRLLFTGIERAETRVVGFPPATLPLRQYVLGDTTRWTGVINRQARRRQLTLGQPVEARVQALWSNERGEQVTAVRWFALDEEDLTYGLYVERGGERIAGSAAEDYLAEILPPQFVPYFFFDGEEIKSYAESNGSIQDDFDKLLRLTFVDELAKEIEVLTNDRKRNNMQATLRSELNEAEAALNRARTTQLNTEDEVSELENLLVVDGLELKRLGIRKTNLSSGASEVQRDALVKRKDELSRSLDTLTDSIVVAVPMSVPALGNLRMMRQLAGQIEARLASGTSAESRLVRAISGQIFEWVDEADVVLSERDTEVLVEHIRGRLHEALTTVQPTGLFAGADGLAMERVRRSLEEWLSVGPSMRDAQVASLNSAHRAKMEIREINEALLHLEVGSQANVEEYREVVNGIDRLETAVAGYNQRKGVLTAALASSKKAQLELARKVEGLVARVRQSADEALRAKYMSKVARALNTISESIKKASREELELKINEQFRKIIDHPLIERIGIDSAYVMTYYDRSGKALGRTSLSSGMKQLVATALLWALKDSANASLPVIIDTPLGRIDRENQDHLLTAYYPALSEQVILLVTNAEIDSRKRGLLEGHIRKHYTIVNETGDAAHVNPGWLVELP